MFPTADAVAPFLEVAGKGVTSQLACELAGRLGCYVVIGYPELPSASDVVPEPSSSSANAAGPIGTATTVEEGSDLEAQNGASAEEAQNGEQGLDRGDGGKGTAAAGIGYNSAVIAGPAGVIGNYRKTFLFETDKVWSREGEGFGCFDLEGVGRVAVGICMGESLPPPTVVNTMTLFPPRQALLPPSCDSRTRSLPTGITEARYESQETPKHDRPVGRIAILKISKRVVPAALRSSILQR